MPLANGPPAMTRAVGWIVTCVFGRVAMMARNARRSSPKLVDGSLVSAMVCGQPGTTYARPSPVFSPENGSSWEASFENTCSLSSGLNW